MGPVNSVPPAIHRTYPVIAAAPPERAHLLMTDWHQTRQKLADTETRMVPSWTTDDLERNGLVTSIRACPRRARQAVAEPVIPRTHDLLQIVKALPRRAK